MLTAEDLKVVLASPSLRQAHGMELPEASLNTLATDQAAFATFYTQWTQQGQPRYAPPTTEASPAPVPVATTAAALPAPPTPSPYGPPPTPLLAPPVSPYANVAGANYLTSPNAVAPSGLARPGMTAMLVGFGVAIVGIIVTAVTWATAAPGGTFVVAWGAIIFGTLRGIIGTVRVTRGR